MFHSTVAGLVRVNRFHLSPPESPVTMKFSAVITSSVLGLALAGFSLQSSAQSFSEGFDGAAVPTGWVTKNLSTRNSTGNPWGVGDGITDADGNIVVGPYEGAGFALTNYTSIGSGSGTISNWLISPTITGLNNGDTFSFFTTTTPDSEYPDRLEFRLSTAGVSTNVGTTTTSVGDFSITLASINPTLGVGGYPEDWTLVTATISGLAAPVDGRVALRYFVTSGGPTGANSNIIGVDSFSYTSVTAVPEPATWALTLGGLVGLVGLQRRRNRRAQA